MNRLEKLFEFFVQANLLEVVPDFRAGTVAYGGLWEKPLSEEEAKKSIDFTGFIDGFEGHAHRYTHLQSGPIGEYVEQSKELIAQLLQSDDPDLKGAARKGGIAEGIQEMFLAKRYDCQYALGMKASAEHC